MYISWSGPMYSRFMPFENKRIANFLAAFVTLYIKVIYYGVLTTKPLEYKEFQFVYICSLLSNTQLIGKQNVSKLQLLSWIGQFDKIISVIHFTMGNFFGNLFYALK